MEGCEERSEGGEVCEQYIYLTLNLYIFAEMSKMIAKLLETDWEEGMSKSEKSGKQTWDKGGGESGGSGRMFYMGDDGRATFENEDDAEEDRTWETTSKRRERRQTRGTIRSRRGTKVDLSKVRRGVGERSEQRAFVKKWRTLRTLIIF